MLLWFQADQLKEAAHHQDDSDLEKKRREAEAILQSMGITADAPVGKLYMNTSVIFAFKWCNHCQNDKTNL